MATVRLEQKYRCSDDCRMEGCPSHVLLLEYQSVSDAYTLTKDGELIVGFERGELKAFISLLARLAEIRIDAVQLVTPLD